MRRIPILIIMLSLIFISIPAWALPPGSYQNTCQNCTMIFNTLSCTCMTNQQFPNLSILPDVQRCRYVTNENGRLRCHQGGNPLPPGSYQQTCRTCHIDFNGNLQCQCQDMNQNWFWTSLNDPYNCNGISNQNGNLTCGNNNNNNNFPPGNYMQTCRGCNMNGAMLSCECQRRDGSWTFTRMFNTYRCDYVQNDNGQLGCPMQGMKRRR